MGIRFHRKIGYHMVCAFFAFFLLGPLPIVSASNLTKAEMQTILDQSIQALLTGRTFGPELERKQLTLRKMFEEGVVSKKELITMVESSMMPILDMHQDKTSIDILKELPHRVEALLSPHMSWQEVKEIGWKIAIPLMNESIEKLLTGKAFSPDLEKKQLVVRKMFEAGLISKAECITMVEGAMIPILDKHKTSRYILKEVRDRVEKLLSPYMTWEEVKEVAWRMGSSLIKDGDQMVLTIGTLAPPGTPWINVPETILIPQIARLSNNKVVVKIFGGGVMGEDTDILRKMDIGQLSGCGCTALGILAASPETAVFLLPGFFRNYDEVDYIMEKFRKRIDKSFEDRGYILGALIDTGFFYMFSKNPVSGFSDLKKQKVLTWFGEVETTLYKELGFDATPVAVPETIAALSTGLANANMAPAAWMLGMQAYQYSHYYFTPPLLYSPGAIVVSVATKEKLRKQFGVSENLAHNVQEMLIYEVSLLEPIWKKEVRSYEEKSLKAFQVKCGMKAIPLSPEDQKTFEQAASRVQEALADKAYPRDLMVDMRQALKEYRSKR